MSAILEPIIINIIGFLCGGLLLTLVAGFSLKFFIHRIIKEILSDENKSRFGAWIEDIIKHSIAKGLKDPKIRKIIVETLELAKEKLKENK